MSAARSPRLGRSGTSGVFAQRAVAARFCMAWRCRRHGHSAQRNRGHQAMDRCPRAASLAIIRSHRRWLSPPGLGQRSGRRADRVVHYSQHGAWNATRHGSRKRSVRSCRTISTRSWDFLLLSHRQVFRAAKRMAPESSPRPLGGRRVLEMPGDRDGAKTSGEALEGEVLEPNFPPGSQRPPLDIGAVITDALKKAGLLKSG